MFQSSGRGRTICGRLPPVVPAWLNKGSMPNGLRACDQAAAARRLLRAALSAMRSWWGSRRTWVRRSPPWMLAIVAVASATGSASLRSLPRVLMRVRPSRKCPSQRSRPAETAIEHVWGGVWNRPGLDLKYRSLVVVSVLAATGHNEELKTHLRGALNLGWTVDELREALLQIGAYAGFSAAHEALDVLSEIVTPG